MKITELKVDQLKFLLRERELPTTGSRDQLVQRLMTHEKSDEIEFCVSFANEDTDEMLVVAQLQAEMSQLREMVANFISSQIAATNATQGAQAAAANVVPVPPSPTAEIVHTSTITRHASVKEIANTLPEYDPKDENDISVDQFIDRINRVIDAYHWDEKLLLLANYTRLKGAARMWLDASPVLHTTWSEFSNAIRDEFGSTPDKAEIHYIMSNVRRQKETIKEYCFRMSALGNRYNLSESAIIRYARTGLKHRELQQSIVTTKFATMKQMRDVIDEYFVNRGRLQLPKYDPVSKNDEPKSKQHESATTNDKLKCFN